MSFERLPPGFQIQPREGADRLPAGFVIQGAGPAEPSGFAQGAARLTSGVMGEIAAAQQGTSPVVRTAEGRLLRELAPEEDQFLFAEQGMLRAGRVALPDPQTGKVQVFIETPETEESAATGAGRVIGVGALAGPVSRVASATRGAAPSKATELVKDFERVKVDPTLGATGGRGAGIVEKTLENVPTSAGIVSGARERSLRQTGDAAGKLAARFGAAETPAEAGRVVIQGSKDFIGRFSAKAERVYGAIDKHFDAAEEIDVPKSLEALTTAASRFDNPELAKQFVDPALVRWGDIIREAGGKLTWNDLRSFRSEIGKLLRKPVVVADVDRAQLERVYGALSDDMRAAASVKGAEALSSVNRADKFYRAGLKRINDALGQILKPDASEEGVFALLMKTAGEGAGASAKKLGSIRKSLTRDEWGEIASTVIHRLGRPTAGQQAAGEAGFSAARFLTNYNKLSPAAKNALFNGAGQGELRKSLDSLLRVAGAQKALEALSNPSGTGRIAITAGAVAAGSVDLVSTLAALAVAPAGAALITSPRFVRWLAGVPSPRVVAGGRGRVTSTLAGLRQIAVNDPDLAPAIQQLADQLEQGGSSVAGPQGQPTTE